MDKTLLTSGESQAAALDEDASNKKSAHFSRGLPSSSFAAASPYNSRPERNSSPGQGQRLHRCRSSYLLTMRHPPSKPFRIIQRDGARFQSYTKYSQRMALRGCASIIDEFNPLLGVAVGEERLLRPE
ncbi:hypothetical protein KM043_004402 [Ampulex compressa]|nr:hypothetical protein KM043_004402 [Ampulex compressa]